MNTEVAVTLNFPQMQPAKRLQELIVYIAERAEGDATFGKVKLAKLLYFADFASYHLFKEPVTGSAYVRWNYGPVPEGFLDMLDEMEASGHIAIRQESYYDYEQKKVIARRRADVTLFSGRDIQLVEDIIRRFWGKSATELSDLSHDIRWKLAKQDEKIPYEASLLSDEALTSSEIERVLEVAKEYNLE